MLAAGVEVEVPEVLAALVVAGMVLVPVRPHQEQQIQVVVVEVQVQQQARLAAQAS
jgi:hypothetical protein